MISGRPGDLKGANIHRGEKSLLRLENGTRVTLEDSLVLVGTRNNIRGVYASNSEFTMNGGEIRGNSAFVLGGVYLNTRHC